MPGKGIARSARRSAIAIRAIWLLGVLLVGSCSGASKFSSGDGDAGESSVGGTSAGSAGDQSGGGVAGTLPSGGNSGDATGGFSGTEATGGTDSVGGDGGRSGASGSSSGGSGLGGTAGADTGGFAGQTGGVGGSAGASNEDCPLRPPSGMCAPDGLVCRYSNANQCLCTSAEVGTACTLDSRCTLLLDRSARIIIDGGVLDGGNPIPTQTCTCLAGTWTCRFP